MFTLHWHHWLHRLPWRRPAPCPAAQHPDIESLDPEEELPLGCGWFDSSHDLQHGLQVREADGEALAQLPLADWLSLQCTPCYEADTSLDAAEGIIAGPTLH